MTSSATETLPESVARRLRGQCGERFINQRQLGQLTGWSSMYVNRRWKGLTALDMEDLETIETVTGITVESLLLPRMDSNHQPSGSGDYPELPAVSGF